MLSEKETTSEEKTEKVRPEAGKRKTWITCAAILLAGGALAAGLFLMHRKAELEFSKFRISSNYLEEGEGASYTVSDWGGGFDILLYNYESEDISRLARVDMTYRVTAEHGTVSVRRQNGTAAATAENGDYLFDTQAAAACHILHVTPDADGDGTVSVTVQTTSPYQKTMTAQFQTRNRRKPDFTVTDQNDGTVLITVNTNDYEDTMTVIWEPDKYSPDTTNPLMSLWTDETNIGHFPVNSNTTCELLFHKKTDDPYTEQKGSATEITLD